jgi:ribonuclease BN (tRNA processing enzyme)
VAHQPLPEEGREILMGEPLRVTILGSGTCVPSLERSACAVLVEAGAERILLDLGPGTLRRLLEAGCDFRRIGYLCISHFHPDHTSELVPFLFASKFPENRRRRSPLTVLAGPGFRRFFEGLRAVYGPWIDLEPGMLRVEEVDGGGRDQRAFGGVTIDTAPVRHNPESVAFRITDPGGRSVVYSGDTDVSDSLVDLASGADLFICESAFPEGRRVSGHLTPSLAGEMAARASVGRLVLTHFYPDCEGADLEAECRKRYAGPIVVAADLMKLTVP